MKAYSIRVTPEVAKTRTQQGGRRNVPLVLTFDVHPVVWLGPLPAAIEKDAGLYIEELAGPTAIAALERPISGIGVDLTALRNSRASDREVSRLRARVAELETALEGEGSSDGREVSPDRSAVSPDRSALEVSPDRSALEAEFQQLTEKKPHALWRDETLRQKIAEARAAAGAE